MAQARRHHLRQQLTPEEQAEFDEHYGNEEDLMFEDDDMENQIDEECEGDLHENEDDELEDDDDAADEEQ